jgi:flagellar biosynthesis protein FlhG
LINENTEGFSATKASKTASGLGYRKLTALGYKRQRNIQRAKVGNMDKPVTQIIGVASGKGGVGKTTVSVNLAVKLASLGKKVMIFDADLGLANAQLALGIRTPYNFSHVLSGEKTLSEVIVEGPSGVKLVPGASGIQRMAALGAQETASIIQVFSEIEDDLDYLIVDVAAGLSDAVMAFMCACQHRIVVVKNEPYSIADAYSTIKVMMQEYKLDRIHLLPNGVESQREGERLFKSINTVVQNFLDGQIKYLHSISADSAVMRAMKASQPLVNYAPASIAAREIGELSEKVMSLEANVPLNGNIQFFVERVAAQLAEKAS